MRRRFVSDEDRDTVVRLRKSGAGWLKIQDATRIPRRTAKRVYEEWQESQVAEEITVARRQVAAEAFDSHMRDLVTLAYRISTGLAIPQLKDRRYGSQVLESIFEIDIRGRSQDESRYSLIKRDTDYVKRQNRILFDSLKEHTKEKVDWRILEDWLVARDEWRRGMDKLESTAAQLIQNILDQETDRPGVSSRIKSDKKLISQMTNGIVETVYRTRAAGKSEEAEDYIKIRQSQSVTQVLFGGGTSETDLAVENKELADKVVAICRWVVTNLSRGKEVPLLQDLANSFHRMETAHRELVERLDELRLTPLILHTRCEICPA